MYQPMRSARERHLVSIRLKTRLSKFPHCKSVQTKTWSLWPGYILFRSVFFLCSIFLYQTILSLVFANTVGCISREVDYENALKRNF